MEADPPLTDNDNKMSRRVMLTLTGTAAGMAAVAGCLSNTTDGSTDDSTDGTDDDDTATPVPNAGFGESGFGSHTFGGEDK